MEPIEETKVVDLPSGEHKVLVRAFLTGNDRRENRRMLLKLNEEKKAGTVEGLEESEDATINMIVLELDGSSENVAERVLKLHTEDYDFVQETVADIMAGLSKKKDSKSEKSTSLTSEDLK